MKFARTLLGLMGLGLLAACAGEYPQSSINPTTDFAETIHGLYVTIFWWSMLILTVVWVVLAYILVKFRERPDSAKPKQIHGNLGMEIAWTIGPALIVVAIAIPTIQAVFKTQTAPEDAMVVEVIGHQYWWEFRYPEQGGAVTANELHIPAGRPISLRLHSDDVIHSFWVPQLGGKRDANPLRAVPEGKDAKYNWIHFTARELGTFMGQCAEFCGDSHSLMGMRVVVETQDEFDSWIEDLRAGHPQVVTQSQAFTAQQAGADAAPATEPVVVQEDPATVEGRNLFLANCSACHAINGVSEAGVIAPNLTLLGRRSTIAAGMLENNVDNLVRWISDPHSVKPGALMPGLEYQGGRAPVIWPAFNLTPDQVRTVANYLHSLR
ncbi:MAG TPA: cytochrome c oxidase subunit II [Longimicrobiales bacterium]|nr:cytochrome c oxidase subunit II [Longimicrobiales bacterium]